MKWFVDKKTGIFWNEGYQNSIKEYDQQRDMAWMMAPIPYPIPPLKVFLGWTPMKEWISKCKPFVRQPINWSDLGKPLIISSTIDFLPIEFDQLKTWDTVDVFRPDNALYRIFLPALPPSDEIENWGLPKKDKPYDTDPK